MKSAQIALAAALSMTVLNSARCLALLFLKARDLSNETYPVRQAPADTTGMTLQDQLHAMQAQMHADFQMQMIHQNQMALRAWMVAAAWNLLLAGLLLFALFRIRKSQGETLTMG